MLCNNLTIRVQKYCSVEESSEELLKENARDIEEKAEEATNPVDENGNPIPKDSNGNRVPTDAQGNPVPQPEPEDEVQSSDSVAAAPVVPPTESLAVSPSVPKNVQAAPTPTSDTSEQHTATSQPKGSNVDVVI